MTDAASMAAYAAEEERRKMLMEEEEKMTPYTSGELEDDWEFKIVRGSVYAFRKPEVLKKLLEEEAQAGWVMVEKFDDSRIRFKRPRSARGRDDILISSGIDPYRAYYGVMAGRYVAIAVAVAVGLMILGIVLFLSNFRF